MEDCLLLMKPLKSFYELACDSLKRDSEYLSDLIYTTYQLMVQVRDCDDVPEIGSLISDSFFIEIVNLSLKNQNYAVLLPSKIHIIR